MDRRASYGVLLLIAFGGAAVAMLAFFARPSLPTGSNSAATTETATHPAEAASVLSEPEQSSVLPPSEPRAAEPATSRESNASTPEPSPVESLRVVGSLRSIPEPSLAIEIVVSVLDTPSRAAASPVRIAVSSAETLDVPLPSIVWTALSGGHELCIWAENAGLRTKEHRARFGDVRLHATTDETEEYRLRIDLEFGRFFAVSGFVVEETDSPMAGATVAVFKPASDSPLPSLLATQSTREDGSFLFELEYCGEIIVAAHFDEFTPATQFATLPCERRIELPPLRVTRGACIRGSVRTSAPGRSVAGLRVGVRAVEGSVSKGQLIVGRESFQWTANGLAPIYPSARTDDEGEFEICGLLPGAYSLHCIGTVTGCALTGATGPPVVVTAPIQDVVIEIEYSIVRFDVSYDGRAVPRAFVALRNSDMKCPTSSMGISEIAVLPEVEYTAEIGGDGFESTVISIPPLVRGEVRRESVRLQKLALGGTLVIELDAETTGPIEYVCVVLQRVIDGALIPESTRFLEQRVVEKTVTVPGVPHDRYRVAVRALGCQNVQTMLAPFLFEADIRSGEIKTEPAWFARGGRVQVRVRDPEGAVLPATCWIEVTARTRWPLHFTPIVVDGVVELTQALEIGDYTVHCEMNGYRPAASRFSVRADEVTRLSVTLTPDR